MSKMSTGGDAMRMTTDIVAAFVANNKCRPDELTSSFARFTVLCRHFLADAAARPAERPKPAAPINKSVQHDYIICLEDGKKLKMLKRYLRSTYNMSPDDYRKRWGLAG
jgi:predicted transcriptional regulator